MIDWLLEADTIRYSNAILAVVAAFLWTASATHQWDNFNARGKRISISICALLLVTVYASVEAAQQDAAVGGRIYAVMAVLVALILALGFRFRDE